MPGMSPGIQAEPAANAEDPASASIAEDDMEAVLDAARVGVENMQLASSDPLAPPDSAAALLLSRPPQAPSVCTGSLSCCARSRSLHNSSTKTRARGSSTLGQTSTSFE